MDHRHLFAYVTLLVLALVLGAASFLASRRWRTDRRQSLRFQRDQARRRAAERSRRG